MRVDLIKPSGEIYDITQACGKITWSGSATGVAREAGVTYLNAPYDKSLKLPAIATGDYLALTEGGEEIFLGQIYGIDGSSQTGTIPYTAYDALKHLLGSRGQYNFKNITPEAIAEQVCADLQVPVRHLHPTGIAIQSLICDGMTMYDIVMAGYTKAKKITGDKYFAMIYKRGLGVYKSEWVVKGFCLSDDSNIYASSLSEKMDDITNRVKVFDDTGKQIGEVEDAKSIELFGVFQDVSQDPAEAKGMLRVSPSQTINLSAIGDINCISNYFVQVRDGATGLSGKYFIKSDSHTWEGGTHKMDLEIAFEAIMDEKEGKDDVGG